MRASYRGALFLILATSGASLPSALGADSLFSDWRIGPNFVVGAPHPLHLDLDFRSTKADLSFAVGGGYLPIQFNVDGADGPVKFSMLNYDARGRWHPFHGSFFLGAAIGRQVIKTKANTDFTVATEKVPTELRIDLNNLYVTPHMGWMWIFGSGFTFGFEFGAQVPLTSRSTADIALTNPAQNALLDMVKQTPEYIQLKTDVEDTSNRIGKQVFPYVAVLRIGWHF